MDRPWKVVFAFVLVFIAGAVFGGVFTVGVSARRLGGGPKSSLPVRPATQTPSPGQPRPAVAGSPGQPAGAVRPNAITPTLMRQFTQRLKLSADQRERVRPIVGRAGEDFVRLRQENLADTARVTERMYADVAALLTPEQRAELEQMNRQMHERVQAERQKRAEAAAAEAANRPAANVPVARPVAPKPGAP